MVRSDYVMVTGYLGQVRLKLGQIRLWLGQVRLKLGQVRLWLGQAARLKKSQVS